MTTPTQTEPLQLSVSNFGPIAKAEIDLRPLTVFVGPSNTGKSYLAILIYALHKFFGSFTGYRGFGFYSMYSMHERGVEQQPLDDDNIKRLAEWTNNILRQMSPKSPTASSPIQLPDFIGAMMRPLFGNLSHSSEFIVEEIERGFGIENTTRLIRHSNREGAKIILRFKPFEYELLLKRGQSKGSVVSNSEEAPLYINPHTENTGTILLNRIREVLEDLYILATGGSIYWQDVGQDTAQNIDIEYRIRKLSNLVLSNVVSPLNNAAHYLPADRTGIMHAHRVVVASLIESASRAGLRRDTALPALSGVLADFLENLVRLSESKRWRANKNNLATNLEQQILKGAIHSKNSETGYPMFSYQPQGWREDVPLMNTSSMVSELAPVVLYLRHIVQPGDVLIIEEPESHLHPKMQVEFIRQLAAVVQSGIRVMLTTHSEWVLDELANLVHLSELKKAQRKGIAGGDFALSRDQVGVWLFEPKQRPKGSVVKEVPFDAEYGGFRSGFDEVAMGTYNDFAEISNRIEGWK